VYLSIALAIVQRPGAFDGAIAGKRDLALLHLLGTRPASGARRGLRAADRRRRRARPLRGSAVAARDQGLEVLVGDRALRQARQPPPRPSASADRSFTS
jgi:hypothetical protein